MASAMKVVCALLFAFALIGINMVIPIGGGIPQLDVTAQEYGIDIDSSTSNPLYEERYEEIAQSGLPVEPMYNFTFTESKYSVCGGGGGGPTDTIIRDLDDDGNLDYIWGGDHGSGLCIYYGNGKGGSSGSSSYGWGYGGSAVGDVNHDGKPDLAVGMHHNYSTSGCGLKIMAVCLEPGLKVWSYNVPGSDEDYGMFGNDFGDFNNDGWLDWGSESFGCCNGGRMYQNDHNGNWTYKGMIGGGNQITNEIFFADVNADGNLDVLTPNQGQTVSLGDGKGGWTKAETGLPTPYKGQFTFGRVGLGFADVNMDGFLDISFIMQTGPDTYMPFLYYWDGSTSAWQDATASVRSALKSNETYFMETALGDLDTDGDIDLVLGHDKGFVVLLNDGTGKFVRDFEWIGVQSPKEAWTSFVLGGDMDHNGYPDIGGLYEGKTRLFFGSAPGTPKPIWVSPTGGEKYPPGAERFIDWMAFGESPVKLEISTTGPTGPWSTVKDAAPNSGRLQWTVPNTPSKNCYFKVTASSASATNPRPFEILGSSGPAPVVVQLNAPNGGENWTVGTQHDIAWTISGGKSPFDVTLEYSVTGASGPWKSITTKNGVGSGQGTYSWTVPSDPSTTAFVKATVKDAASQTADDASNAAFIIYKPPIPPVDIAYVAIDPHAPVTLYVGDTQSFAAKAFDTKGKEMSSASIAWTVTGSIGNLSQASGASSTFTAITAGSGSVKVTATYNTKSVENSTSVTVLKVGAPTLAKVEIVPSSITGSLGQTFTLTAKATDSNGTDITDSTEFTWGVGLSEIVQLGTTSGKSITITLKSAGETTVSLSGKYAGASKVASAGVKVTKTQVEFPWWILYLIIAVMVIVVILMAAIGRRKKKKQPYDWEYQY